MIDRKLNKIREGKDMLHKLISISAQMDYTDDQIIKDKLAALWAEFKQISSQIEQITWALNSNKEHLRYVARIHVIPEVYQRSEDEQVHLKKLLIKVVQDCHQVIEISRSIRHGFEIQLRSIYGDIKPNTMLSASAILPQYSEQQIEVATANSLVDMKNEDNHKQEISDKKNYGDEKITDNDEKKVPTIQIQKQIHSSSSTI